MRFLHLSDLHIGKSLHGVSLLENGDQGKWVEDFIILAENLKPDAIVIAGDIYDRSAPSGEAVELLDKLVTGISNLDIPLLMVAGNHDSGQRLSFGGSLLAKQKLHISGTLSKELPHVTLEDAYGPVTFWLMPYVFPHLVAAVLEDDSIRDYETAVRRLLESQNIDFTKRNVLVAHQNVTQGGKEAERGGSESMVGGIDGIDYTAFDGFDYVALGHIHSAYSVGRDTVRYAGSPLCYHFDETRQKKKGPVLVELGKKGTEVSIATQTIEPLHPLREIKGDYNDINNAETNNKTEGEYIRIVLKDRPVDPKISTNLHEMFENRHSILMELTSEYYRFSSVESLETTKDVAAKSLEELFSDFYTQLNGGIQPDESKQAVLKLAEEMVRRGEFNDQNDPSEKEVDELLDFVLKQEDENETD